MPNTISTTHVCQRLNISRKALWALLRQEGAASKDGDGNWRVSADWKRRGLAAERTRNFFHPALQSWKQYNSVELTGAGVAHLYNLIHSKENAA